MIPGNANSLLLATAAADAPAAAGPIKSLRFNSADSAYLSRTPSSAGNRKTWTWSAWAKRGKLGTFTTLFSTSNGTGGVSRGGFSFHSNDKLTFWSNPSGSSETANFQTDAVFRDASAWYHIVLHIDTTQSTNTDRIKVYVNGAQQSFSSVTYMAQNEDAAFNQAFLHSIGEYQNLDYGEYYLADVHFIDGSALGPTSFGAYDSNNVWQAATYSGTFGTNGFHLLDFANESTIGHDSSGNENDFTANNLTATVADTSRLPASPSYRESTSTNQTWDNSSSASSTSSAIGPDRIYWVDLGSSQTFNKVTFDVVASGQSTDTSNNFIIYFNTASNGLGSSICNNCGIAVEATRTGTTPGTISVNFSGFATQTGRYIGITNGYGGAGGTYTYSNWDIAVEGVASDLDVLFDVPTNGSQSDGGNGGEVSGNYATLNPLDSASNQSSSNGNLEHRGTNTSYGTLRSTFGVASGKWYWEGTVVGVDATDGTAGLAHIGITTSSASLSNYIGSDAYGWMYNFDALKFNNGSSSSYGNTYVTGDIIGVALDMDAGTLTFYKNGTSQSQAFSGLSGTIFPSFSAGSSGAGWNVNFGQRAFAHSAPSGFKALNTASLPTPTIADGSDYFASPTWTGDGGSSVSVTTGFEPDFIWIKQRNKTYYHQLYDAVRGYGVGKALASNANTIEGYGGSNQYGYVSATSSTGFTGTAGSGTPLYVNENNTTYVAWCWDAGSSTVSNSDGTITSSVRANASAGFSIVNYVGTGANATVGHDLNAAPGMIIIKNRDSTFNDDDWRVWHSSLAANERLVLNATKAVGSAPTLWQNTLPTSSVFYLDSDQRYNANGDNHIAYCFAPVAGYSAFGSYTGNGSSDGPFVFTGFRPAFLMWKLSSAAGGHWNIEDNGRSPVNPVTVTLRANTTEGDLTTSQGQIVDLLSNGFKVKNTSGQHNTSGETYVYMAFASNPFSSNGGLAR